MTLVLTFVVCLVSAFVPVVNAEAYLAAVALRGVATNDVLLAATAAVGQTVGKTIWFYIGQRSIDWGWVRRRLDTPKGQRRYELWRGRVEGRPVVTSVVLLASAFIGLPPFAIMAVLAGQLRVPVVVFVLTGLAGRLARFTLVVYGVELLPL